MGDPVKVVSLNVGLPRTQYYGREVVWTAGAKRPVPGAVLRLQGFEGDEQADWRNHGGVDKAVCVYPLDHYPYWAKLFGRPLEPASFSENLTVSGAVEDEVCIGDVFGVGEAVVQVSQPRTPCGKLAGKNRQKMLTRWVAQAGYTGFYMRVLSEGLVSNGDAFEPIERHPERISVADVNDIVFGRSEDESLIERLSSLPEFGADGRTIFAERLERLRKGVSR
jgi:MOSC domain-containing protein YiiM